MARPDPERIFAARKTATLERLVTESRVPRPDAIAWLEHLLAAGAGPVVGRRDPAFWEDAYRTVIRQVEAGHKPKG